METKIVSDYMIRPDNDFQFTITKWDGGHKYPDAIYIVTFHKRYTGCTCTGYSRNFQCKHIKMIKEFKRGA